MLDRQQLEAIRTGQVLPDDLASIVIPHYRTEDLVRLCLRAIRRLTNHPYEVIVVDNHSADGSLDYLRRVGWIRLIERGPEVEPDAPNAHAAALTIGMAAARGRWLVSFHTDTIVRREDWLNMLISRLKANPRAAVIGAGKQVTDPAWYRAMQRLWDTHRMRRFFRRVAGLPPHPRYEPKEWFPRTFCAVYRLDVLRQLDLSWKPAPRRAAGDLLYRGLMDAGHEAIRLSSDEMYSHVDHIRHATGFFGRGGTRHKYGDRRVKRNFGRVMATGLAQELLTDDSLDR